MPKYILMQIGCPECKTKTLVIGTFNELESAKFALDKCNDDKNRGAIKVDYEVFEIPRIDQLDSYYKKY